MLRVWLHCTFTEFCAQPHRASTLWRGRLAARSHAFFSLHTELFAQSHRTFTVLRLRLHRSFSDVRAQPQRSSTKSFVLSHRAFAALWSRRHRLLKNFWSVFRR
mmetsp:Transcript_129526/g.414187  ORF Transcript_129526/g.414187 Transcript_129526/m.414187 type:complete len:104 (+) Transcript_129526:795-1106(+)